MKLGWNDNAVDLIGDIHGHADKLKELLKKLEYTKNGSGYSHPERKVIFIGDYIDRGPQIKETLEIVKQMNEEGNAIALMGNHEYNALCFHSIDGSGGHLRKHSIKNIVQHYKTLEQFKNFEKDYSMYITWCKTLPLFFETSSYRAVHACWEDRSINFLRDNLVNNKFDDQLLFQSTKKGSKFNNSIDITLKGKEIALPNGITFTDKDGDIRKDIRVKWWIDPAATTYKDYSVESLDNLPTLKVDNSQLKFNDYYPEHSRPVFFGHYWLNGNPTLYRNNICCLDYSVAKDGHLAAYRFNGEKELDQKNFVFV